MLQVLRVGWPAAQHGGKHSQEEVHSKYVFTSLMIILYFKQDDDLTFWHFYESISQGVLSYDVVLMISYVLLISRVVAVVFGLILCYISNLTELCGLHSASICFEA